MQVYFLAFIILVYNLLSVGNCTRPAIVEGIVDEVRPIDSTATLNCSVALFDNSNENVQWLRTVPGSQDKLISSGTNIQEQNPILQGDMRKYEVRIYTGRTPFIPDMGYAAVKTFTLIIRRVTNLDAGRYKCRINIQGEPKSSPAVTTNLIIPREPFINPAEVTANQVVEEGANVTLRCIATAQPEPRINWIRANGLPLNLPGRPQRVYGSEFTISNVTKYDRGVYRCHANNNVGYGATHDVRIDVNFAPSVRAARLYGLYLQAPDRNFEVTMECISGGFPDPEVSFYIGKVDPKPGELLKEDDLIKNQFPYAIERLRSQGAVNTDVNEFFYMLRIKNVLSTHFGNYSCVAKNKYGVAVTYLQLMREEVCQGPLCFGAGANLPMAAAQLAPRLLLLLLPLPLLLLLSGRALM